MSLSSSLEPYTYKQTIKHDYGKQAMDDENVGP